MLANSEINHKLIFKIIGRLLYLESAILIIVSLISLIYAEGDFKYFMGTSLFAALIGSIFTLSGLNAPKRVGKREGSIIVTFVWLIFSLIGAIPFFVSGSIPFYTDAFFETVSGFTTTGASVVNNIESLTHTMLLWRSLTQWIGGLGIIMISLALIPMFGTGGAQVFSVETSAPVTDKMHARISDTAKRIFWIYVAITFVETVFLLFGGMNAFDAVCHSFGTVSTGGFSTKQASIGYYNSSYIEYVIAVFMIISSINFGTYYLTYKKNFNKIKQNEELRYYVMLLLAFVLIVTVSQINFTNISSEGMERAWRESLFSVSSLMSTTGMVTTHYAYWKPVAVVVFILIMMMGSSTGSTSGGIKMIRIIISAKACYYEFKHLIHPTAVIPVRYNKHIIREDILTRVMAFALLYIVFAVLGIFVLAASGMSFVDSVGGMISCVGGVGSAVGLVSPMDNFSQIPEFSKWFLTLVMIAGRLELYTVLIIFTPVFWKK